MSRQPSQLPLPGFDQARAEWRRAYGEQLPAERPIFNRSGVEIAPLYTPEHFSDERYMDALGFPGHDPMTRGIYPSMHRGRAWSQRQLIGLGVPEDYNRRLKRIRASGGNAVSLIPCNSVYRGLDADQVDPLLLGTCGAVVNTVDDMDACFADVAMDELSTAMNDPLPFTLLALLLAVAKRRGIPWTKVTGTSNQSDYISHFVANHMFFRIALPGSRRILVEHIAFTNRHVPGWNPVSVVGQHMQQAGATPAEAMAFTLCTRIPASIYLFLRHLHQLFRRDRQVPRRSQDLGAHRAPAVRRQEPARRAIQVSCSDFRRRSHATTAVQQHRPGDGPGHGGHFWRAAVASH
jgi:methylmalonyl-CoA mutase N-terminal domain/subunit